MAEMCYQYLAGGWGGWVLSTCSTEHRDILELKVRQPWFKSKCSRDCTPLVNQIAAASQRLTGGDKTSSSTS